MAYANFLIQSGVYGEFSDNGPAASMDDFNLVLILKLARSRGLTLSFGDLVERKLKSEEHYLERWKEEARNILKNEPWQAVHYTQCTAADNEDFTSIQGTTKEKQNTRDLYLKPLICDKCHVYSYLGHIKWVERSIENNVFCFRCHLLHSNIQPDQLPTTYSFERTETVEIQTFFKEYGFVVVKDCIPTEICHSTDAYIMNRARELGVYTDDGFEKFETPPTEYHKSEYYKSGLLIDGKPRKKKPKAASEKETKTSSKEKAKAASKAGCEKQTKAASKTKPKAASKKKPEAASKAVCEKNTEEACKDVREACKVVEQCLSSGTMTGSRSRISLLRPAAACEKFEGLTPLIDRNQYGSSTYGFDKKKKTGRSR
jgi:hypothetical protein